MVFSGKIKCDILGVVYRWIWQSKINEVNKEFTSSFDNYYDKCRNVEYVVHNKIHFYFDSTRDFEWKTPSFNYRVLDHINCKYFMLHNYDFASKKYIVWMSHYTVGLTGKFDNYCYTSTKYLREIKERGIVCLSLNDNV